MKFSGEAADVRWGYYPAARLGKWSCERTREEGQFTATVLEADAFKLAQSPLVVVIPAQPSPWKWALSDVQITGDTLTARVVRGGN